MTVLVSYKLAICLGTSHDFMALASYGLLIINCLLEPCEIRSDTSLVIYAAIS